MFWRLLSQMTKTTDPHKESRAKTEEKGKDNENSQDISKNHQESVTYTWRAYNRKKKKKNLLHILSVGYSIYS